MKRLTKNQKKKLIGTKIVFNKVYCVGYDEKLRVIDTEECKLQTGLIFGFSVLYEGIIRTEYEGEFSQIAISYLEPKKTFYYAKVAIGLSGKIVKVPIAQLEIK